MIVLFQKSIDTVFRVWESYLNLTHASCIDSRNDNIKNLKLISQKARKLFEILLGTIYCFLVYNFWYIIIKRKRHENNFFHTLSPWSGLHRANIIIVYKGISNKNLSWRFRLPTTLWIGWWHFVCFGWETQCGVHNQVQQILRPLAIPTQLGYSLP